MAPNRIDVHHHFVPDFYRQGPFSTTHIRPNLTSLQLSSPLAETLQVGSYLIGLHSQMPPSTKSSA